MTSLDETQWNTPREKLIIELTEKWKNNVLLICDGRVCWRGKTVDWTQMLCFIFLIDRRCKTGQFEWQKLPKWRLEIFLRSSFRNPFRMASNRDQPPWGCSSLNYYFRKRLFRNIFNYRFDNFCHSNCSTLHPLSVENVIYNIRTHSAFFPQSQTRPSQIS